MFVHESRSSRIRCWPKSTVAEYCHLLENGALDWARTPNLSAVMAKGVTLSGLATR
jgi:hypothetical protein